MQVSDVKNRNRVVRYTPEVLAWCQDSLPASHYLAGFRIVALRDPGDGEPYAWLFVDPHGEVLEQWEFGPPSLSAVMDACVDHPAGPGRGHTHQAPQVF